MSIIDTLDGASCLVCMQESYLARTKPKIIGIVGQEHDQLGAATTKVVHHRWAYCVGREGKMCDTKELGPIIKMRSLIQRLTALLPRQLDCYTEWRGDP